MLRLLAGVNFNHRILDGWLRRIPDLDLIIAQDAGLGRTQDPALLEWAAREGRVLLTHDVHTMIGHAYERVRVGRAMPGVFEVSNQAPLGRVIDDLTDLVPLSREDEWEGQVVYIPL